VNKELYTYAEAAEMLSVSVSTVRKLVAKRNLRIVKLGRSVRIPRSEILRLIDEQMSHAA
jgi:excisionase family DNA binding protein